MKKTRVPVTFAALLLAFATSALAADYPSISVSAKLYYRDSTGAVKSMGGVSGKLFEDRNGARKLRLAGKDYVVQGMSISEQSGCADMDHSRSPYAKATIEKDSLGEIMLAADNTFWRARSTKAHVAQVIREVSAQIPATGVEISGGYCAHDFIADDDNRDDTIKFADTASGEALKLVIRFGRSISYDHVGSGSSW